MVSAVLDLYVRCHPNAVCLLYIVSFWYALCDCHFHFTKFFFILEAPNCRDRILVYPFTRASLLPHLRSTFLSVRTGE